MGEKDQTGVIKVYYPVKGYGFISRTAGRDVFFYRTSAEKEESLIEGSTVRFNLESTPKGPKAINVVRVS
ncbi:retron Se72 family effector protein [Ramlibacter humi]|uniref:Cold shock domain-containing protein n=1 Tax=Ramlibacter humi TaxID=2530451 RepID=A0A4Z0BE33_9BURK|nr:retron Se72 family effector protein [Ramlibacter humi]TFY97576.1 cold shock domain-containing protein [Ramlibacter humi]